MQLETLIARLEVGATTIAQLVRSFPSDQARWKPTPEDWSVLEVVCHLLDEERDDFRFRIEKTLYQPDQVLPPIDPPAWVSERNYLRRELSEVLSQFLNERQQSLAFLRTLEAPNWDLPVNHPSLQGLRAGDLLVSWVAHDLLHTRQLVELHWAGLHTHIGVFDTRYAGDW